MPLDLCFRLFRLTKDPCHFRHCHGGSSLWVKRASNPKSSFSSFTPSLTPSLTHSLTLSYNNFIFLRYYALYIQSCTIALLHHDDWIKAQRWVFTSPMPWQIIRVDPFPRFLPLSHESGVNRARKQSPSNYAEPPAYQRLLHYVIQKAAVHVIAKLRENLVDYDICSALQTLHVD